MADFWDQVPDAKPQATSKGDDFWSQVPDASASAPSTANPQLPTIPLSPRAVPFRLRTNHPDTAIDKALEYTSGYEYDPGGMIVRGAQGVASGIHKTGLGTLAMPGERTAALGRLRTPEGRQHAAEGVHDVMSGGMEAATPLLPFGVAAAPAASLLGLGTGMAAQEGVTRGAKALGVPDAYSNVMGDVAGLAAGTAGGHLGHSIENGLPLRRPASPTPVPEPTSTLPESAVPISPRTLTPPPVDELGVGPEPRGDTYHIPDQPPPPFPVPTGMDAAIRAHEQLGPVANTIPRRLLGTTPYQENLLNTLGPTQAGMLPRRLAAAQPDISPGGRPGLPDFRPAPKPPVPSIDKMVNPTTGEVTYWDINRPGQAVSIDDPRVQAYERDNPNPIETARPSMPSAPEAPTSTPTTPALEEETTPPQPKPLMQTATTAPEIPAPTEPTGPLSEPDYEAPTPPEPTPLEEPKTPPVMQEPQPEAPPSPPVEAPNPDLDQIAQSIAGQPFNELPPDMQEDIRTVASDPEAKQALMDSTPSVKSGTVEAPTQASTSTPSAPSQLPPRRAFSAQRGAVTPDFLTSGLASRVSNLSDFGDHLKDTATRLRDFWTGNLSGLGNAYDAGAKQSYPAARRLAAPEAQARVALVTTLPKIESALKDSGISRDAFLATLGQDRLLGVKSRYEKMAKMAEDATPAELTKAWNDWGKTVFSSIDDSMNLGITENAAKLLADGDYKKLNSYLARTFRWLGSEVSDVDLQGQFGKSYNDIVSNPKFHQALGVYKNGIEGPFSAYHAMNDGFFSEMGPLNTYFPLSKIRDVANPALRAEGVGRAGLETPDNPTNYFATGLGQAYDFSVDRLHQRLSQSIKANGIAGFIKAVNTEGLGKIYRAGEELKPLEFNGTTYAPEDLVTAPINHPVRVKVGDAYKTLPSPVMAVPKWLAQELKWNGKRGRDSRFGAFESEAPNDNMFAKISNSAIGLQLMGPAEAVLHTFAISRGYIGGTPFLGKGLLNRTIGNAPGAKTLNGILKVAMENDPMAPENAPLLQEMAANGYLHSRSLSTTLNQGLSDTTGIPKESAAHFSQALLFGPKGTDTRIRLAMAKAFKASYPDVPFDSPAAARFMSQVIDYNKLTQAGLQSAIRNSPAGRAASPFISAAWTRVLNGLRSVSGVTALPNKDVPMSTNIARRIENQLSVGIAGVTVSWMLGHKALTGLWPWDDPKARLFKLPVPDEMRDSKMGKTVWGDNTDPAYVDMAFSHPTAVGGAKEIGAVGAYDTSKAGGDAFQVGEEATRNQLNTAIQALTSGPAPQIGLGLLGVSPYLQSLTDSSTGAMRPTLRRTARTMDTGLKQFGTNVANTAGHLNPLLEPIAEGIGALAGTPKGTMESPVDRGNHLVQAIFRYSFPGAFTPTRSQEATTMRLRRQQVGRMATAARERMAAER